MPAAGRVESVSSVPGHQTAASREVESDLKISRYKMDLSAHLAECDGNYLRLTRLMPDLQHSDWRTFRILLGTAAPMVTMEVVDRSRYTTVVALSQHPVIPRQLIRGIAETRIKVRLCHDARTAEVIEFQGQRQFDAVYRYPNRKMRQPDEKAQVNRFLSEFLSACLRHGVANEEPAMIGS